MPEATRWLPDRVRHAVSSALREADGMTAGEWQRTSRDTWEIQVSGDRAEKPVTVTIGFTAGDGTWRDPVG